MGSVWIVLGFLAVSGMLVVLGMGIGWAGAEGRLRNLKLKERRALEEALMKAEGLDVNVPHHAQRARRGVNAVLDTLLSI